MAKQSKNSDFAMDTITDWMSTATVATRGQKSRVGIEVRYERELRALRRWSKVWQRNGMTYWEAEFEMLMNLRRHPDPAIRAELRRRLRTKTEAAKKEVHARIGTMTVEIAQFLKDFLRARTLRTGAKLGARLRHDTESAKWKRWQSMADDIWNKYPRLTSRAVALKIALAEQHAGEQVSSETVRKRIRKSG